MVAIIETSRAMNEANMKMVWLWAARHTVRESLQFNSRLN